MKQTKRQYLPSGLWVVATPIGNLEDLTPRAKQALAEANTIFCEDTRRTSLLLHALENPPVGERRLERLDAHSTKVQIERWVEKMKSGGSYALVTDAGTPGISDPGARLVAEAIRQGIQVTPVPGVSAVITLLSVAGFLETPFCFRGYFPRKKSEQEEELLLMASNPVSRVFVWYESPLRIKKTAEILAEKSPEARVVAAKELTKLHEKFFHGSSAEVQQQISSELQKEGELGEWCLAVEFPVSEKKSSELEEDALKALSCLLDAQVSVSEAAKQVSQHFGISKRVAYDSALQLSGKKNR